MSFLGGLIQLHFRFSSEGERMGEKWMESWFGNLPDGCPIPRGSYKHLARGVQATTTTYQSLAEEDRLTHRSIRHYYVGLSLNLFRCS